MKKKKGSKTTRKKEAMEALTNITSVLKNNPT